MQGVDNPDQALLRSAQAPSETVLIFTQLSKYAVGCYLRYGGFPRRTLLGSSHLLQFRKALLKAPSSALPVPGVSIWGCRPGPTTPHLSPGGSGKARR